MQTEWQTMETLNRLLPDLSTLFAQTCLSKNKVFTIVFCLFLFSVKLHIAHLYEVQVCIARKFYCVQVDSIVADQTKRKLKKILRPFSLCICHL